VELNYDQFFLLVLVYAWIPLLMGQAGKLLICRSHRDCGGWLVFLGAGFAGLQVGVWTFKNARDSINWPINGRTNYLGLILVAIVLGFLGFLDCLIRFIRLASSNAENCPSSQNQE
jgi:hypothetical protein